MNCQQCGNTLSDVAQFCGDCGIAVKRIPAQSDATKPTTGSAKAEALAKATLKVLKAMVINPVEGLPRVFAEVEKIVALQTGLVLAGLFDLCAIVGLFLVLSRWGGSAGFEDVLKLLVLGLVPPLAITGSSFLAHMAFQGKAGTIESDVFLAGVSVVPMGLLLLLSGLLGVGNIEVIGLVGVFCLTYTILILFSGCTRISQIATVRAIPAVPIIIIISAWVSKIIFSAMF
jgi:hypothetical protein